MSRRIFSIVLILGLLTSGLLLIKPQQGTQAQTAPTVSIVNMSFQPASLTINVGQTVTWTNNDTMAHTVTSDTGVWNSGTLNPGGSFSFTFTTPGTYTYHCAFHGSMTGTIVVGPPTPTALAPTKTFTRTSTATNPVVTQTGSPTRTPTVTSVATLPDLTVSSITYIGSNPTCANNPQVQVVVANIGAFPANGSFSVSVSGSFVQTVNGLAAGQSVTLIFSAGSNTATVDSTNVITETNEANNSLSGNFGVPTQAHTCTPTGPTFTPTRTPTIGTLTPTITPTSLTGSFPDLVISSVVSSPPGWTNGCALTQGTGIRVTVRNNGTVNAGTFIVDVSGTQQTVASLAAGASLNLWFSRTGSLVITADITNMVAESSESNNTFSFVTITGTPPVLCTRTPTPTGSVTTVITNTPTRTITITPPVITLTPTRTLSPTISPTVGVGACSPVTSTITVPFTFDGAGTFCWQASALGTYVNSWNTVSVTINGVNATNLYVASGSYPAKINGFYYISYNSSVAWGHLETK